LFWIFYLRSAFPPFEREIGEICRLAILKRLHSVKLFHNIKIYVYETACVELKYNLVLRCRAFLSARYILSRWCLGGYVKHDIGASRSGDGQW